MAHVEALKELAKEYSVRSAPKLIQLARKIGANYTLKEAQQALSTSVPAQTLAPPPRSLGHSAAEAPGSRLQADLADFRLNSHGHSNDDHHYFLQASDVFTRKAYTEPLKNKTSSEVDAAMHKILHQVPNQGKNAVVTTDKGKEFTGLEKVLPQDAVHREKQSINDISVVDRTMQTLKKDLEDKAQTNGQGWAHNLKDVTSNYNFRPNSAVHGSPDTAGEENAQQFYIMQDQANNFMHNRNLTLNRQKALTDAGAYREPIYNGGRSFKPSYGNVHNFKKFGPGGGTVEDSRGNEALLKEVRPVVKGSGEPLAHITFQRQKPHKKEEAEEPKPAEPSSSSGGASGSHEPPPVSAAAAGGVMAAQQFSQAQLRRVDPVSAHIMNYQRKTTDEERAEAKRKKDAAQALREQAKNARIDKSVAAEMAKQKAQLERMMKKTK